MGTALLNTFFLKINSGLLVFLRLNCDQEICFRKRKIFMAFSIF